MSETNGAVEEKKDLGTVNIGGKDLPVMEGPNGELQAKDENNNVYVLGNRKEQKRLSKIEMKRAQQYQERRKRLIGKGVPEDKVDQAIAEEDYRNMPIEKKFDRFVNAMQATIQRIAQDVMGLRHNDGVLADAMDVNFKAMARMLTKLGIPLEEQAKLIGEVENEINAERKARMEAESAQRRAQAEASLQKQTEELSAQALAQAETEVLASEPAPPDQEVPVPEGATSFGD